MWDLFLIPEEVEPVKAVFTELRAGEFPNEYENFWVAREGDHRLIAWSNTALLSDEGEVEYVIGTGIDTTERRQAEEALQKLTHDLGERVKELNCLIEGTPLQSIIVSDHVLPTTAHQVGNEAGPP